MVSIIMLACVFGLIGGLIAFVKALIQKKKKKALIWLGIVVSSSVIYQTIGTTYWTKHPQEQVEKQQAKESLDKKVDKEEKKEKKKKQDPKDITKAECEQIKYHMTYEEVRKIATYDAEITSSEQIGDELVQHQFGQIGTVLFLEIVMKNKIVTNWWGVCERK